MHSNEGEVSLPSGTTVFEIQERSTDPLLSVSQQRARQVFWFKQVADPLLKAFPLLPRDSVRASGPASVLGQAFAQGRLSASFFSVFLRVL